MAPLSRPTKAYRVAVAAIAAKRTQWVAVPSPGEHLAPLLEAMRCGRPYSSLPPDHAARQLRPPPPAEPVDESRIDPSSPGSRLADMLEQLRQKMAADKDPVDSGAIRRETVREIEREQRDTDRRARQRAKRARKAARRAEARATAAASGEVADATG